ncbi:MAG: hypothetical protein JWQ35_1839 [Bacteriovoracaceae bacterium]|nr:hypothetical protein [Bacteriovoracaceae bacterium]
MRGGSRVKVWAFSFILISYLTSAMAADDKPESSFVRCGNTVKFLARRLAKIAPEIFQDPNRLPFLLNHSEKFREVIVQLLNRYEGNQFDIKADGRLLYTDLFLRLDPYSASSKMLSELIQVIFNLFPDHYSQEQQGKFTRVVDDFMGFISASEGGKNYIQQLIHSAGVKNTDADTHLIAASKPPFMDSLPEPFVGAPKSDFRHRRLYSVKDQLPFSFVVWLYGIDEKILRLDDLYDELFKLTTNEAKTVGKLRSIDKHCREFKTIYNEVAENLWERWKNVSRSSGASEMTKIRTIIEMRLYPLSVNLEAIPQFHRFQDRINLNLFKDNTYLLTNQNIADLLLKYRESNGSGSDH